MILLQEKAIATLSSSDANINKIVARVEANLREEEGKLLGILCTCTHEGFIRGIVYMYIRRVY